MVDWLKHIFVCHHNNLTANVYEKSLKVLCMQWESVLKFNYFLFTQAQNEYPSILAARCIGFVPYPLVVLLLRTMWPLLMFVYPFFIC